MQRCAVVLAAVLAVVEGGVPFVYDVAEVNGHPGYISAWDINGDVDNVLLLVSGHDTDNTQHPQDTLYTNYKPLLDFVAPYKIDVIYFDYQNGHMDIKKNADNLARFIEYLRTRAVPNFKLSIIAPSMGGIVARTMFVQERSNMGAHAFVTIDAPHWGISLSNGFRDLTGIKLDNEAGYQMIEGARPHLELYRELRSVEQGAFMREVIDPMHTCAIALADGTKPWTISPADFRAHGRYWPVASLTDVETNPVTLVAYHSAVYLDDDSAKSTRNPDRSLTFEYKFASYHRYFDVAIPNPQAEHGAPAHTIKQAVEFIMSTLQ